MAESSTPSTESTGTDQKADASEPVQPAPVSARGDMPAWKWKGSIVVLLLTTVISGYDVSNVANIQARLYEAFGNIELLPWIGLSYSLASFAVLGLSRKILYCFNMRWIYIVNVVIFMAGAAVAGAAPNISAVIVGRIIMGVSDGNLTFVAVFASPTETPRLFGLLSATWAIGLVIGGPIGSALAANHHTTWRWAFYMNLPWVGLALVLSLLCIPSKHLGPDIPILQRIIKMDPIGLLLNMASPVLFAVALELSGSVWRWSDAATIAVWVLFGVITIAWFLQQSLCIFTTREERSIPLHLLQRIDLLPLWFASGCAGASYAVTLYYTPLYFAFARGHDALQQTVRILPFILVFIAVVIFVGGSLPKIGRYAPVYLLAGLATISAAAAMATLMPKPSTIESTIMGLEALIEIGLGCSFQHGVGISNVMNQKSPRDRVDSAILFNMAQMGAIAIVLAVAGCIFHNVGYNLLNEALEGRGYSEHDLREALAGVSSVVWQSRDPEVIKRGVEAVSEVIGREFYLVVAGGAICLVCSLLMKWERLDYGQTSGTAKGKA